MCKVVVKGENTSAIYRLKITEKYAFVQTTSKLVKAETTTSTTEGVKSEPFEIGNDVTMSSDSSGDQTSTATDNDMVIYSSHSIIK